MKIGTDFLCANFMKSQSITWEQIKNLLPIFSTIVVVTVAFVRIEGNINVMDSKLDNLISLETKTSQKMDTHLSETTDVEHRLTVVETLLNIKKTTSYAPVPITPSLRALLTLR